MNDSIPRALLIMLLTSLVALGLMFAIYHMVHPPMFQHRVNSYTVVEVDMWDCKDFGRNRETNTSKSLEYKEKGADKTVSDQTFNLSNNIGVKACVAAFVERAQKSAKGVKPSDALVGFFSTDVHSRFELETKENTPYITAYYRKNLKLNTLTFPIEACVNPQFEGVATFAHNNKIFNSATLNALEHQDGYMRIVDAACTSLLLDAY